MVPFKITVQNWTTKAVLDITPYLGIRGRVSVTDEQERAAFERVAGDIHIELLDPDRTVKDFLFLTDMTTSFMVEVFILNSSGVWVMRWRGEIDAESIGFNQQTEVTQFDGFSCIKAFWDKAKVQTKFFPTIGPDSEYPNPFNPPSWPEWRDNVYVPFQTMLFDQVFNEQMTDGSRLYRSVETSFALRKIRAFKDDTAAGNEGQFKRLDDETTVDDLIRACLIEYNAIAYIDVTTGTFHVEPRYSVPTSFTDIEPYLLNKPIEMNATDGYRFDWLLTYSRFVCQAPVLVEITPVNIQGDSLYRFQLKPKTTYVYKTVGYRNGTASAMSDELSVFCPALPAGSWTGWKITFDLPPYPEGFTTRGLFRRVSGAFMKVAESDNNFWGEYVTDEFHGDQTMLALWNSDQRPTVEMPAGVQTAFDVYSSYTEDGGWVQELTDFAGKGKLGKVFDARPQLRFKDALGNPLAGLDYYWMQSFFGREYLDSAEFTRQNFVDLFRLRRGARLAVKGLDWYVGQGITLRFLPNDTTVPNNYVVKKVVLDLLNEQATLEVFSV